MNSEQIISDKERKKAKIRERYKGISSELPEVIPAKEIPGFYDDVERRVAVYVRVSTDNLQQTSSYELQKNYYEAYVHEHEKWTLADIYADEGISGTSLQHRDSFNRMIDDCRAGKIDLIITKSVARFSRNLVDCISIVRELRELTNPVAVFFETEHIYTLNDNIETQLGFIATMAQEESHTKSSVMNLSYEMRFSHGILLTPMLLGYDHDDDGNLVVNAEEAATVRLIFFMYIFGCSCKDIADRLSSLKRKTKKGSIEWNAGSVLSILRNERYCGDVLARKTFTPNYLNHKSKKNTGERNRYLWKNRHESIISRDDFIAVQHMLNNAKYGCKSFMPELRVVAEGELKGFVSVNPRWAGFTEDEYICASQSVCEIHDISCAASVKIEAAPGDFDLRKYEIAREEFFNTTDRITVTFSNEKVAFGICCIKKFNNIQFIEMFVHPIKKQIAIRPADKKCPNAMKWAKVNGEGNVCPRTFSGIAFLKIIFNIFGWNNVCKYRIHGYKYRNENDVMLIFDANDAQMLIPRSLLEDKNSINNVGKSAVAYPTGWLGSFGENAYVHTSKNRNTGERISISEHAVKSSIFNGINPTSSVNAKVQINNIIEAMEREEKSDG